jgi:hypothetical protein
VSPVRYELGFDIPEDGILHSHKYEDALAGISCDHWPILNSPASATKHVMLKPAAS